MEKKTRKYYRVKIYRIPPYSSINGSYYYEEDVWAYSEDGARNKIEREHKTDLKRVILPLKLQKCYFEPVSLEGVKNTRNEGFELSFK